MIWTPPQGPVWRSPLNLLLNATHMSRLGFPSSSDDKESACYAGDPDLIPGSGRSSGERNGNPLQYSCLENPMDRELGGLQTQSMRSQRAGHDWTTDTLSLGTLALIPCPTLFSLLASFPSCPVPLAFPWAVQPFTLRHLSRLPFLVRLFLLSMYSMCAPHFLRDLHTCSQSVSKSVLDCFICASYKFNRNFVIYLCCFLLKTHLKF